MQQQTITKIKGLLGIANKAGYLIIGSDNLKGYDKKMYLLLTSKSAGKTIQKITKFIQQKSGCNVFEFCEEEFLQITGIFNCKIVGIKNKGISEEIIKYLRSNDIDWKRKTRRWFNKS